MKKQIRVGVGILALLSVPRLPAAPPDSSPAGKAAVEGKNGWGQIDQRLVFLTVELSTVESSITATNKALKSSGYKLADLTDAADRATARNVQMDRQGGGPVPWAQFYGRTAKDFFYHPTDDSTVYVNPLPVDQRPPQFDYIYRANEESRSKAEADAAALGTKIDDLLAHRKALEAEQLSLWCKISFRGMATKEFSSAPLYRFDLVTVTAGDLGKQRVAAIKAGADFIRAVDAAVATARSAVDTDEKAALDDLRKATSSARADIDARLLQLTEIAVPLGDVHSPMGQFHQATRAMEDLAENMTDAYRTSTGADVDADPSRKSISRGQFQQAVSSYAEAVLASDRALNDAAKAWSVTPDPTKAATSSGPGTISSTGAGDDIPGQLQTAKADNQITIAHARKELLDAVDSKINSAADAGDLAKVQALQPVKASVAKNGTIPPEVKDNSILSAKSRFDSSVKAANDHLLAAYRQAIHDFTRTRRFTEAQAAQDELAATGLGTSTAGAGPSPTPIAEGDAGVKPLSFTKFSRSLPTFLTGAGFSAMSGGIQIDSPLQSKASDFLTKNFVFDVQFVLPVKGAPIFIGLADGTSQTAIKLHATSDENGRVTLTNNDEWGEDVGNLSEPGTYIVRVEKLGRSVIFSVGTEDAGKFTPVLSRGVVDIHGFNENLHDKSTRLYIRGGADVIFTGAGLTKADSVSTPIPSVSDLPMGTFPIKHILPTILTGGKYGVWPDGISSLKKEFQSVSHAFLSKDYTCDVTFQVQKERGAFVGLGLAGKTKFIGLDMRPSGPGLSVALNHNLEWPKSFSDLTEEGTYVARIDKQGQSVTFSVGTGEGTAFKAIASKTIGDMSTEVPELNATNTHLILGDEATYSNITISPPIEMPTAVATVEPKAMPNVVAPAVVTPSTPAGAKPAAPMNFVGWYRIVSKVNGKPMAMLNKRVGSVPFVKATAPEAGAAWAFDPLTDDNGFRLVSKLGERYLAAKDSNDPARPHSITQGSPRSADGKAEKNAPESRTTWKLLPVGDHYRIMNESTGQYMTEHNDEKSVVTQEARNDADNQLWKIEPIAGNAPTK